MEELTSDKTTREYADLEAGLRRCVALEKESPGVWLGKVALNFLSDPWNHTGLCEKDLRLGKMSVLWHAAKALRSMSPLGLEFKELPNWNRLDEDELSYWTSAIFLSPPSERQSFIEHMQEVAQEMEKAATRQMASIGFRGERLVDWLVTSLPMPHDTDGLTVAVYGRTSSGKTTVVRRLIEHFCPEWIPLAAMLAQSPAAHTTRIPLVFDLEPQAEFGWWFGSGTAVNLGGYMRPSPLQISHRNELEAALERGHERNFRWVRITLPSSAERSIRLVDTPGTHGFDSGVWSRTARNWLLGADLVLLPGDRRHFRAEEKADLWEAMRWIRVSNLAFVMRWVSPDVAHMTCSEFIKRRIMHGMEADFPQLSERQEEATRLLKLLERIKTFELSKRTGAEDDDIVKLARWISSKSPSASRRPTHSTLSNLALGGASGLGKAYRSSVGVFEAARRGRIVLHLLGLIRAWNSCMNEVLSDEP